MDNAKKVSFQDPSSPQPEEKELLVVVKDNAGEKRRWRKRSRMVSTVSMETEKEEEAEDNSRLIRTDSIVSYLSISPS